MIIRSALLSSMPSLVVDLLRDEAMLLTFMKHTFSSVLLTMTSWTGPTIAFGFLVFILPPKYSKLGNLDISVSWLRWSDRRCVLSECSYSKTLMHLQHWCEGSMIGPTGSGRSFGTMYGIEANSSVNLSRNLALTFEGCTIMMRLRGVWRWAATVAG